MLLCVNLVNLALVFSLYWLLSFFTFHKGVLVQLASLLSLWLLSLLRELASLISAPINWLCFWLRDHRACHFWLHTFPGNIVLWSQEMLEGPGNNTYLMGLLWSELEDVSKVPNMYLACGERSTIFPSEKLSNLFPFPCPPNPGLCRCASHAWNPTPPFNLGCTFSRYHVPLLCSTSHSALYIFLWLCYGCCPLYQTLCAGGSDEPLRSTFRI